ncbi:ER membrane protein complex subunit [Fasciolopsis buskii]|uniref:ER membrane protein complex subunit 3 n=1 Tax=Fasciolopsis buskii TaxID=27845 RepID=A0A8E0RTL8_9TREM|nr:ER membrane protein complex subunit [Fasciolopsis buski]
MRKYFFNHKEHGFFRTQKRENQVGNPMTDPSMASEMLKSNALNMVPMIVIGSWINWAFSGFLTTKVPFPLTYRFKPMLQRGCESLSSLNASWVSSASWYFLNIFGLRSMYGLVLGSDNAAEQPMFLTDQPPVAPGQPPQDMQKAFKAEWEALEVIEHQWALADVESRLITHMK